MHLNKVKIKVQPLEVRRKMTVRLFNVIVSTLVEGKCTLDCLSIPVILHLGALKQQRC
jgi:hypothetical protein